MRCPKCLTEDVTYTLVETVGDCYDGKVVCDECGATVASFDLNKPDNYLDVCNRN